MPKIRARLTPLSIMRNGKSVVLPNWKDFLTFTRERKAMVYVQSAYDIEELVDVALDAAELLRQQYETVFKKEMKYAPLQDMILTALVM